MAFGAALDSQVWRILSPRRAHAPLSGEGAARYGGRWNRPGQPALYLSEQIETAFAEYQQELGVRPGTFVAYHLRADLVADLTDARVLEALNAGRQDLLAPWKAAAWVEGQTPPSWRLSDVLATNYAGARTPSAVDPGGTNIVLWRWNAAGSPRSRFWTPAANCRDDRDFGLPAHRRCDKLVRPTKRAFAPALTTNSVLYQPAQRTTLRPIFSCSAQRGGGRAARPLRVIPGPVPGNQKRRRPPPGIEGLIIPIVPCVWFPGTRPGMTARVGGRLRAPVPSLPTEPWLPRTSPGRAE